MNRALIIGCGYTGQTLARRLLEASVAVTGTSVSGPGVPGVAWVGLDLKAHAAPDLPAADGAVVYFMVPPLTRVHDPQQRAHMVPLEAALRGLEGRAVQALVYLSSTSVYGDAAGAWVDEQTPPAPLSPWGRMRVELEQRIWAHGQQTDTPCCVVRLPEIYGPGRGPVARLRKGYTLRYPLRYTNRIHVDDLALVLHELGRRPPPRLLLVADGHPATAREVYQHAATLLGLGPVPESEGERELDPNRLGLASESKRCRTHRLMQWLGRPLRYPTHVEGLPTTL